MIIAIEGIDGSGKQTQTKLLGAHLCNAGHSAATMSFPRYGSTHFAGLIGEYLNGKLGDPAHISPKLIGLLYAGDRLESREEILELMTHSEYLVFDRYIASNLAYQSAKAQGPARAEVADWLDQVEHGVYHLPRADLNIFLDVPVDMAMGLVRLKRGRTYTDKELDIHEANRQYLQGCRDSYQELIQRKVPGPWVSIDCVGADGGIVEREEILKRILDVLRARGMM